MADGATKILQPEHPSSSPPTNFEIVSVNVWHNKNPLPLIDLRPPSSYLTKRLHHPQKTTPVVNLPLPNLFDGSRSCELPPRYLPFALLVPASHYHRSNDDDDGVTIDDTVSSFFLATRSRITNQSRKAWRVRYVLLEEETLWDEAKELGAVRDDERISIPFERVWEPDSLVANGLLPFLLASDRVFTTEVEETLEVWDLGSGAGRDVCFLAEECLSKWCNDGRNEQEFPLRFVGVDSHKGSAKTCIPLWERRGVGSATRSVLTDLKKVEAFVSVLERSSVICCYAVRYLNRRLLDYLVGEGCGVESGFLFGTSHFCTREDGVWDFDHPKEKSVLKRSELKDLFQESRRWEVLKDDICVDGDHGRTMIQFIARRL